MIRILLVDDHPVVRLGIRHILRDGLPSVVVGEASDAPAALASLRSGAWDLVILDLTLPGPSGLDLLKEIRQTWPDVAAIVLSMHSPVQFERRVRAAGAAAFLTKDSAPTELVKTIEQLRRARRYATDVAASPAVSAAPHDALSDREYQVLRMLGSGRTTSQIAQRLQLSVKTVSTYRTRLLEKLQMHTNAEVMRYAIENQLLDE